MSLWVPVIYIGVLIFILGYWVGRIAEAEEKMVYNPEKRRR